MDKIKIIMLGVQGCGKGTQAVKIAQKYKIPHISTGDMFRDALKEGTELGKKIKKIMEEGNLVDDDTVNDLVQERLQKNDCEKGYILDGYPRTTVQAEALANMEGNEPNIIVSIELRDKEAFNRADGRRTCKNCKAGYNIHTAPKPKKEDRCDRCGKELLKRADDNKDAILARIEKFHNETEPIKEFFSDIVIEVDGSKSISDVEEDIASELKKKIGR